MKTTVKHTILRQRTLLISTTRISVSYGKTKNKKYIISTSTEVNKNRLK
jgi:hypothetical protein